MSVWKRARAIAARATGHTTNTRTRSPGLRMRRSQDLPGTYPDEVVNGFAQIDSQARVSTTEWGDAANSWPHTIDGTDASADTATDLVSVELQPVLASVEARLEEQKVQYPALEADAFTNLDAQEEAEIEQDRVVVEAREEGLTLPDHAWRRTLLEVLAFVTLAVGDLYFTATAFQVLGLSDKQVGFIPLNELQLAATSVVSAMLVLTWIAGHLARGAAHELIHTAKGSTGRRWGWVLAAAFTVADGGAFLILNGLSAVRTAYLAQQGTKPEQNAFLSIQIGVAVAGVSMAFWSASPLHQKWRRVTHNLAKATKAARRACRKALEAAGEYNATTRERIALLHRHRAWSEGIRHDALRKDHLYGTMFRAAFSEPVADATLPAQMDGPDPSYLVTQIDALMAGKTSTLKNYPEISTARLHARMDAVDARRRNRHKSSGKKP